MQVGIAIEEADAIVFVVSGREGVTRDDEYIARLLQKTNKKIILAVNKIDDESLQPSIYEFYQLVLAIRLPFRDRMASESVIF